MLVTLPNNARPASATASPLVARGGSHARKALDRINDIPPGLQTDYIAIASGFPTQLQQSGLAPAVGQLLARSRNSNESAPGRFLEDLAHVLGQANGGALHEASVTLPMHEYSRLNREALAAAEWLNRFSKAFLKCEGGR